MPVEAVDCLCPYCNCVVTYYCDGGIISSPDYVLVAEEPFEIIRSAVISTCGLYRLRLDRTIAAEGLSTVVLGVNPSKADGLVDDPTIVKVTGFGRRLGWRRYTMGNKFAFRATDVSELKRAADPIGELCDDYLEDMIRNADVVVAAWGPLAKLPRQLRGRWRDVAAIADHFGKQLKCWGVAQDGQPRHPLMLAYDTPLIDWKRPL
jgi:hypothetical protein